MILIQKSIFFFKCPSKSHQSQLINITILDSQKEKKRFISS